MTTPYRKRGTTVRIERSARSTGVVELTEAGKAWFDAGTFFATESSDRERMRPFGARAALQFAETLEGAVRPSLEIERYTITQGAAEHEVGTMTWRERNVRVHISLLDRDRKTRMRFELGGASFDDIDSSVVRIASDEMPQTPIARLLLPPHVSAALWPALLAAGADGRFERRTFRIRQRVHRDFAIDGVGSPIGDTLLLDAERPAPLDSWPNYFRPSYRTPPMRAPFHVTAECDGERMPFDAVVVALGGDVAMVNRRIVADLVYGNATHTLSLTLNEWMRRLEWIGETKRWFPFGSGSWGADAILRVDDLRKSEYRLSSSRNRA